MTILGPDGRPIAAADLSREIATVTATGVRRPWYGAISTGLDPRRLGSILRGAVEGQPQDFYTLAEEMEEREPHYGSVLATAKLAVSGLPVIVEAASDQAGDVELADAVRTHLVGAPAFRPLLQDLLDALGKGFSAVEINWNTKDKPWRPAKGKAEDGRILQPYIWRDPRFFLWDKQTGQELRLLDAKDRVNGLPLPSYKFIIHVSRLKTGLPVRGGLARLAAISYMAKFFVLEDWLAFAEVFGIPMRLGRYGPGASKDDIRSLINAVTNLGTDAAAVLPESMKIEFQAAVTGQGTDLFRSLAEWIDLQVSKAVLGHTASADSTAGRLGGESEANEIREDRKRAIANQLSATLQEQLVEPFIILNWGEQSAYPQVSLYIAEREDLTALADNLAKLVPLGLKVEQSVIRDKLGLPDPDEGADLLGAPSPLTSPPGTAPNRAGPLYHAANRDQRNVDDLLAELEDEALAQWQPLLDPVINPVQDLADKSASYDDFLAGLPQLLAQMTPKELIDKLAEAAFKARGVGDAVDG